MELEQVENYTEDDFKIPDYVARILRTEPEKIKYPIEYSLFEPMVLDDGREIKTLTMREPQFGDLSSIDPAAPMASVCYLAGSLSGVSREVLDEYLGMEDVDLISKIIIHITDLKEDSLPDNIRRILKLPVRKIQYPIQLKLKRPIPEGNREIDTLEIKKPTLKHVKILDGNDNERKMREIAAKLTTTPEPILNKLSISDGRILQLLVGKFLTPFQQIGGMQQGI